MTVEAQKPKPWQLIERLRRWDAEIAKQNRDRILSAYESLSSEGSVEVSGYEIAAREAALRHPEASDGEARRLMVSQSTMNRALSDLVDQGVLSRRIEIVGDTYRTLYSRVEPIQEEQE